MAENTQTAEKKGEKKAPPSGVFSPIVVLVRNQIGTKNFNQLRGKGISLHSQGELWAFLLPPQESFQDWIWESGH